MTSPDALTTGPCLSPGEFRVKVPRPGSSPRLPAVAGKANVFLEPWTGARGVC